MLETRITLTSAQDTCALAERWAPVLRAGDVLLLEGSVGAGKTHFARSLIQALLAVPEDVPSPTFTLVQTYDAPDFEIWHADLYRLSSPDEVIELGLEEAFSTALCLVEWPDRLGGDAPAQALFLHFEATSEEERVLTVRWHETSWAERLVELVP